MTLKKIYEIIIIVKAEGQKEGFKMEDKKVTYEIEDKITGERVESRDIKTYLNWRCSMSFSLQQSYMDMFQTMKLEYDEYCNKMRNELRTFRKINALLELEEVRYYDIFNAREVLGIKFFEVRLQRTLIEIK